MKTRYPHDVQTDYVYWKKMSFKGLTTTQMERPSPGTLSSCSKTKGLTVGYIFHKKGPCDRLVRREDC